MNAMTQGVQMDILSSNGQGIQGTGSVAQRLLSCNFNVAELRTCTVLRKDEWQLFDEALVQIARQRLRVVQDLVSAGLTFNVPDALGVTRIEWERISDMEPAELSMSGVKEGQTDRVDFDLASIPLPIIHKDFNINIRALHASRKTGQPLDTTQVQLATRLVSEKIEDIFYNGANIAATNGTIYGFLNAPNRNTGSLATNGWDDAATTGEQIVDDVLAMMAALEGDNMYGPYGLYVNYTDWNKLQSDFKANSDRTILERLQAIDNLSWIRPSSNIPANQVVMFQVTSDVVQAVIGMQPTVIEWESHGGMVSHFKVMAIMIPRVRDDYAGQSGIAHYSA